MDIPATWGEWKGEERQGWTDWLAVLPIIHPGLPGIYNIYNLRGDNIYWPRFSLDIPVDINKPGVPAIILALARPGPLLHYKSHKTKLTVLIQAPSIETKRIKYH